MQKKSKVMQKKVIERTPRDLLKKVEVSDRQIQYKPRKLI